MRTIPQIEAAIAQATPKSKSLMPLAALSEALLIFTVPLPISVRMACESNKSHNPMITPAIVPASPQYNGIGVCTDISFSTVSQCLSIASFKTP